MKLLPVAIIFLLLLSVVNAQDYSVGVSPPVIDAGVLGRGESKILNFAVVTQSPDPLTVQLGKDHGTIDFFSKPTYAQLAVNYSEQRTAEWIEFLSNPVELLPTESAGFGIRGARAVNFLLNVPEYAEPGYHVVTIRPTPIIDPSGEGQVGSSIVALTTVNLLFRIDGSAVREGRIFDVTYDGAINTFFKNTGTVTLYVRSVNRINKNGAYVETSSSRELVRPGEFRMLSAPFSEPGRYEVNTVVDYTTNKAEFNSEISVVPRATAQAVLEPGEFPWWIVIAILIIAVSIFIYRRRE